MGIEMVEGFGIWGFEWCCGLIFRNLLLKKRGLGR